MIIQAELKCKQTECEADPCAVDMPIRPMSKQSVFIGSPESWGASADSMSGSGKYCPAAKAMSSSPSAGTYIRSTILCTFLWIPPHARCGYGLRTS